MSLIKHAALASFAGLVAVASGCATPTPRQSVVPNSAMNVEAGSGSMHFMAPKDGTVYVYDPTNQRLIWSGDVTRNETVDVEPEKQQILAGGKIAATGVLVANARSEVYFNPAPAPEPQPVQASHVPPPPTPENGSYNNGPAYNNGVILTPNVSVQPSTNSSGSVEVQPRIRVSPASQPAQP